MPKLSYATLQEFEREFFDKELHNKKFHNERYGQAVMNYFNLTKEQEEFANSRNLFYETSIEHAKLTVYLMIT